VCRDQGAYKADSGVFSSYDSGYEMRSLCPARPMTTFSSSNGTRSSFAMIGRLSLFRGGGALNGSDLDTSVWMREIELGGYR
jgi:hypothetical protein